MRKYNGRSQILVTGGASLACPASPVYHQHDPVQTTKTRVHGAINMPGLARRTGARAGRQPGHAQTELIGGHGVRTRAGKLHDGRLDVA